MSPDKQKIIRERIRQAAEKLEGRLPDNPRYPKGRNPCAHIQKVIKTLTGISYWDLSDEGFDSVMEIIQLYEDNPF